MQGLDSTTRPASGFSSVTGSARWVALGVVGIAGVGGAIWTYVARTPRSTQALPEAVVVPRRELGNSAASVTRNEPAMAPAVPATGEAAASLAPLGRDTGRADGTKLHAEDRRLASEWTADRPMIVWRSRLGPHAAEAEGVVVEADRPSAEAGGEVPLAEQAVRQLLFEQRRKQAAEAGDGPETGPKAGAGAGAGSSVPRLAVIGKPINVNKATQAELELLPDVGPALAKRIVEHRIQHGAFKSFEDLDKVRGIGPKTIEKFKGRVVFSDPPPK